MLDRALGLVVEGAVMARHTMQQQAEAAGDSEAAGGWGSIG
jgi:hypothetical protein